MKSSPALPLTVSLPPSALMMSLPAVPMWCRRLGQPIVVWATMATASTPCVGEGDTVERVAVVA
jgi:hypothetical protein